MRTGAVKMGNCADSFAPPGPPARCALAPPLAINTNAVRIFGFPGVVAAWKSAPGLFALVSLNILKRMKEIVVRKDLRSIGLLSIVAIVTVAYKTVVTALTDPVISLREQ